MSETDELKGNYEVEKDQKKLELLLMFMIEEVKKNMEELLSKDNLEPFIKERLEMTYSCAYFVLEEAKKVLTIEFEIKTV
jgi:uncharacterized protein YutD